MSCGKYICGLHDRALCQEHASSSPSQMPLKWFVIFLGVMVTFVIMTAISQIIETLTMIGQADDGDVVVVDGETVTVTETIDLPSLSIIITVFFVVSLGILSVIGLFLYRWSHEAKDDDLSFIGKLDDSSDPVVEKFYFCHNCGQKLRMSDLDCTKCGKSTEDERNLVK